MDKFLTVLVVTVILQNTIYLEIIMLLLAKYLVRVRKQNIFQVLFLRITDKKKNNRNS